MTAIVTNIRRDRRTDRLTGGVVWFTIDEYSQDLNDSDIVVEFFLYFEEDQVAERDAWIAQFPKSHKIYPGTLTGYDSDWSLDDRRFTYFDSRTGEPTESVLASQWELQYARAYFRLFSNGVTGEKNESAYKRLVAFLKRLDALGISYEPKPSSLGGSSGLPLSEVLARFA